MRARIIDWSLAASVGLGLATGLTSLVSGRAEDAWVFALHGMAGWWLLLLLGFKLRRVSGRILPRGLRRWPATYRDWRTWFAVGATLLAFAVLATGFSWVAGVSLIVAGYNLLNWHIIFAFGLVLLVSLHMVVRAKPLRRGDLSGRRAALRYGVVALGAAVAWPAQQAMQRGLNWPGAQRRFTGSREIASFQGNAFPTVSWIADRPAPLPAETWRLALGGAVAMPQSFDYDQVNAADELIATLDCTGGFYSTQYWAGIRVGRLLDAAGPLPAASWVRFVSVTGYRWSLPLAEARAALLATRLGGEPLSYGHGAPARLVAPGQRGLVWVKWLVAIDVLTGPDPGQLIAINTSSFR